MCYVCLQWLLGTLAWLQCRVNSILILNASFQMCMRAGRRSCVSVMMTKVIHTTHRTTCVNVPYLGVSACNIYLLAQKQIVVLKYITHASYAIEEKHLNFKFIFIRMSETSASIYSYVKQYVFVKCIHYNCYD